MTETTRINWLTGQILDACIEVHKNLGPGLLESIYEECLCYELELRKIPYERQKHFRLEYKGKKLQKGYKMDILVDKLVPVELKAQELRPIDFVQIRSYLRHMKKKIGLLINFNVTLLKEGYNRIYHDPHSNKKVNNF